MNPRSAQTVSSHGNGKRAWLLYGGASVFIVALHLATNGVLGFHIDELYYLESGRHLSFGYVDYPPLVPLFARIETSLLGVTPWTLRLLPSLLSGIAVPLCGLYVRKLGGSLTLQALGLLIGITVPFMLGTYWLFQTVTFDQLCWMIALYWFLSLVLEGTPRNWIFLGITLGIGLEIKYTIIALIAGMGIAILVTPSLRAALRTRSPWIGAGLSALIWAPNLIWQVANRFPSLTYIFNHQGSITSGGGIGNFLTEFAIILFFLIPLWVAGIVSLIRHERLRPLAIACMIPFVVFLFVGKSYYPAPAVPLILAQGVIAVFAVRRKGLRTTLAVGVTLACILNFVLLAKYAIPLTPPDRLHATGLDASDSDFSYTVGWISVTKELTALYQGLPEDERSTTVIVTSDYGVTGALQIYGNPTLLPASYSPELSDAFLLPAHVAAKDAIMVGYTPQQVRWMCDSPRVVTHLTVPYHVVTIEQDTPVVFCRLKHPLTKEWKSLEYFS